MGGVDKEYEDLLLRSWGNPDEQINHIIYKERKVMPTVKKKIHTQELHYYHMKNWGNCPYCDAGWVIGTHKEIIEGIDKR